MTTLTLIEGPRGSGKTYHAFESIYNLLHDDQKDRNWQFSTFRKIAYFGPKDCYNTTQLDIPYEQLMLLDAEKASFEFNVPTPLEQINFEYYKLLYFDEVGFDSHENGINFGTDGSGDSFGSSRITSTLGHIGNFIHEAIKNNVEIVFMTQEIPQDIQWDKLLSEMTIIASGSFRHLKMDHRQLSDVA